MFSCYIFLHSCWVRVLSVAFYMTSSHSLSLYMHNRSCLIWPHQMWLPWNMCLASRSMTSSALKRLALTDNCLPSDLLKPISHSYADMDSSVRYVTYILVLISFFKSSEILVSFQKFFYFIIWLQTSWIIVFCIYFYFHSPRLWSSSRQSSLWQCARRQADFLRFR